jgi:hypothetical protein
MTIDLKSIQRGDHNKIKDLRLSPSQKSQLFYIWYEDYVNKLKENGLRFPSTVKEIADEVMIDRQHFYKNKLIEIRFEQDKQILGMRAPECTVDDSKIISDRLDHENNELMARIHLQAEEIKALSEKVNKQENELHQARLAKSEERSALDHLFTTGRRVLL